MSDDYTQMLIEKLPPLEMDWPEARRIEWFQMFAALFDRVTAMRHARGATPTTTATRDEIVEAIERAIGYENPGSSTYWFDVANNAYDAIKSLVPGVPE